MLLGHALGQAKVRDDFIGELLVAGPLLLSPPPHLAKADREHQPG
jgi:hypothetical protein